jgi:large subunit ribosomal protein L35
LLDVRGRGLVTAAVNQKPLQANKHRREPTVACRGTKKEHSMPKMKTKSGAKKRFRVRPGGTVKRGQAFKRHILTKKSTTRKRHLRGAATCTRPTWATSPQMLPFAGL